MEDFIISETAKIFSKAIKRYAKRDSISEERVSILLGLYDEGEIEEKSGELVRMVRYDLCHDHTPAERLTIMEVLGVKIDFKMYSVIVPPQIKNILEGFESRFGSRDVEVMVYLNREQFHQSPEDEEDEVAYFAFKSGKVVTKFKLEQVLNLQMT